MFRDIEGKSVVAALVLMLSSAECHAGFGDARKALELVNGLPETHRDSALRYVSKAQVERGTLDRAAETAAMIRQPVYRGETLQRIATAYAERADFVTAKRLAGEIPETSGQTHAWAAIAVRQLQTGDRSAAEEALPQAIKTAGQIPYDPAEPSDQKPLALAAIARAQAEFGDVETARRTVQRIAQAPWQDLALGEIASVQAQRGEFQAAVRSADAIKVSYYPQEPSADIRMMAYLGLLEGLPTPPTHKPKATRVSIQGPFKKYGTLSLKDLALPDECRSFIELDRMKLSDRPSVDSVFVVFTFKGEEDPSRVLDVQCIAVNEQGQPIVGHREVFHDPRIAARKPRMGGKFRLAPFANISIQLPKGELFSDVRSIDLVVTQVCDEGPEGGS